MGQLNWLAGISRPEISFQICKISARIKSATIADIKAINKVAWYNKKYNCGGPLAFKSWREYKNYCITISIQKISSIHKIILKVQQILGYHELTSHGHFWPHPPKNNWINFKLSRICTSMQKISLFHLFISEIQSILKPMTWLSHSFLTMTTQKILISF